MSRIDREQVRSANPLQEVIPAITGHQLLGVARERLTTCPFHDDHEPSLRVNLDKQTWFCDPCGQGGDVFMFVQRSRRCGFSEALRWLAEHAGLGEIQRPKGGSRDGGGGEASPPKQPEHSNTRGPGVTLAQYAASKSLPESFLCDLGLSNSTYDGRPAIRIPYLGAQREERAIQFRLNVGIGRRDKRFRWKKRDKPCPYGLWRLDEAYAAKRIALVEGASDAQTLWFHGIPALGLPSASTPLGGLGRLLEGIDRIDVVIEPDTGGQTVRAGVAATPFRDRVWLVELGRAKDPSDLYLQDRERFPENWKLAMDAARKWTAVDSEERAERAAAHCQLAQPLLEDAQLMTRIGGTIRNRGYAGDVRPVLLAYLAITSRLLQDPMNLAFVAQSAAGKNAAVNAARDLMPQEATHEIRASSERALIYDAVDVRHKTVIFSEADSIPEDGAAASAVRSLASDNVLEYDTVERDPETGKMETRRIRKDGPTGFITTSTRPLRNQLGTRMLEVPIGDDPTQTRAILLAQAEAASGRVQRAAVTPFIALQRWLAGVGRREIMIPFAGALAALLPAMEVRVRRDFTQLLTCVKTVAFLYQHQRTLQDGQVVATIEDYAIVRQLLSPIFDAVANQGCTPAVRETVLRIGENEKDVSASELAKRLGLAKSTVSERVRRAMRSGWLINEDSGRGHAARYRRGAPLPELSTALPNPARVQELHEGLHHPAADVVASDTFKEF